MPRFQGAKRVKPRFDVSTRVLSLGSVAIKHFHVPAENQELILLAFQELGWPVHIDDPLPPTPDIDAKQRLHDAIKRLNGNQRRRLLHFHGNGKGTGLTWTVFEQDKQ